MIGGGVNGAGIARDAAGRGLSVLLCEKGDLGEGTSSRSGKLIHGGLRYLEYYEFRLVREALIEREVLLRIAPHIVWPMRFVLPHSAEQRPAWMVRLGLFLYDHLGGRKKLPGTRKLDLRRAPEGAPIREEYRTAFEYSDCWVEDARLVVLNALDAARARRRGAGAHRGGLGAPRGRRVARRAARRGRHASARRRRAPSSTPAGPWVERVIHAVAGANASSSVRLVKGSHIIVRKFWEGAHAYLLQNDDKRVIFVNPYEGDLCLIGTTDIPYEGRPEDVAADPERARLSAARGQPLHAPPADARPTSCTSISGVRPLYDDAAANPSAVTRDYVFDVDGRRGPAADALGVRRQDHDLSQARRARARQAQAAPSRRCAAPGPRPRRCPAATCRVRISTAFLRRSASALSPGCRTVSRTTTRASTARARRRCSRARAIVADLGRAFRRPLYEREADFLRATEWARTAEDMLERRTKHYLHMTRAERDAFADWMLAPA